MRAWRIDNPGAMSLVDVPAPQSPGAGEVLLGIERIGYCGTDLNTYRGLNPLVQYPRVPGHEIAAVIEAVGAGVPAPWREGLAVTVVPYTACGRCPACRQSRENCCQRNQTLGVQRDGAMCERFIVPWDRLVTSPKLGLTELALIEPLSVGFHAVSRGRVQASDTVCVLGSGMIGLGVIAGAALERGARVIAVDVDDRKLEVARLAGASETINSRTTDLHSRLGELTDGEGPGVIVEAIGLPQTFVAAVEEVAYAGRIVYIGYAKQEVTYVTKHFILKELDILGSRNATVVDFGRVIAVLESGWYPVRETVTATVPVAEAGRAMAAWAADPASVTKTQVAMRGLGT